MKKILSLLLILSSFGNLVMGSSRENEDFFYPGTIMTFRYAKEDSKAADESERAEVERDSIERWHQIMKEALEANEKEPKPFIKFSPNNKYFVIGTYSLNKFTISDIEGKLIRKIKLDFPITDILWRFPKEGNYFNPIQGLIQGLFVIGANKKTFDVVEKLFLDEDLKKMGINAFE